MKIPHLTYGSRQQILLALVKGRKVLHLGCVGDRALKQGEPFFHEVLSNEASELWGVDLNSQGVDELAKKSPAMSGQLFVGDVCKLSDVAGLPKEFDVIVAGDLIEHLANPSALFENCRPLLNKGGTLVITTPNALGLLNVLRSWRGFEQINPAHTCWFSFATLHELSRRLDWKVDQYFTCHDHEDYPYWKKVLAGSFFKVFPQWGGTLVAVAKPL